jgi:predicted nuclease with RNAse H fold
MIVVGIDLSIQRPSAVVAMNKCEILYLALAESDDDITAVVSLMKPLVVAVDAPLSYPPEGRGLRDVERDLRRLGFHLLPPLMGSMKKLTERGIALSKKLTCDVIEVHPLTSMKAMGLTREELRRRLGVRHKDLIDAFAAALTAVAYVEGLYKRFGPFVLPTARVCI